MNLKKFKIITLFSIAIILVLGLSISFQSLLAAWSAPTANPPTCPAGSSGCAAPLNVGPLLQTTTGALWIVNSNYTINPLSLIVENGNVGIGSINPTAVLHISKDQSRPDMTGATKGLLHLWAGSDYTAQDVSAITFGGGWSGDTPQSIIGQKVTSNGGNLFFGTSNVWGSVNNTAMYINYNGNVGIGNTAPTTPIDIQGIITSRSAIADNPAAPTEGLRMSLTGYATTNRWRNSIFNSVSTNPVSSIMQFRVSNGDATQETVMSLLGNGNVGIGTNAPNYQLDIQKSVTGGSPFNGLYVANLAPYLSGGANGFGPARILLGRGANNPTGYIESGASDTNSASGYLAFGNRIVNVMTEAMRIKIGTGDVGVGTINPGYKFDVQGGQINSSGGLCIAGDCKTAWSQVTGSGNQWTTSGLNIYYNTGNVGIGTTNPGAKFQIGAPNESDVVGNIPVMRILGLPQSQTSQTMLRLNRPVSSMLYYNGGVDFNVYAYDVGGGGDNYIPHTQLDIALKSAAGYSETANVNVMSLRDNGNVGIGTVSPGQKLEITSGNILLSNDWFYAGKTTGGSAKLIAKVGTDDKVHVATAGDLALVETSGNVGIGTTNPAYKLDVVGTAMLVPAVRFISADTFAGLRLDSTISQVDNRNWFIGGNSNAYGDFAIRTSNALAGNPVSAGVTRLLIDKNGNVGIGTVAPTQKLDIVGDSLVQGSMGWDGAGDTAMIKIGGVQHGMFAVWGSRMGLTTYKNGSSGPNGWGSLEALTILETSGNVGISNSNPGYKLDVQGGQINTSGGLCIAGDCKTAWSQVGGGSSQWTTSGLNIYYNTGNVGIGATSPGYKLDVQGGNMNISSIAGNPLTGSGDTAYSIHGWQAIGSYDGWSPNRLFINGYDNFSGGTTVSGANGLYVDNDMSAGGHISAGSFCLGGVCKSSWTDICGPIPCGGTDCKYPGALDSEGVCQGVLNKPDGTDCGGGGVCSNGICNSCPLGGVTPCSVCGGTTDCSGNCSITPPGNLGDSCSDANNCIELGQYDCSGECIGSSFYPQCTSCTTVHNGRCDESGNCVYIGDLPGCLTP
jgi:hypothetical protein